MSSALSSCSNCGHHTLTYRHGASASLLWGLGKPGATEGSKYPWMNTESCFSHRSSGLWQLPGPLRPCGNSHLKRGGPWYYLQSLQEFNPVSQTEGLPQAAICSMLCAALLGCHCSLCVSAGEVFSQKRNNEQDGSEFIGQTLKLLVKRNVSLEL
ncbi:hypothetical protein H8958_008378, partial [Nasalis larvatus]